MSYIWSEQLLVSVGSLCVCDSHEGGVRFVADPDEDTCSELCQDSDVDGSEFPGCKCDLLIQLLSFCGVEEA